VINNQLGNKDIRLSAIGLGTWAIGGGDYKYGWGAQDDKDSIATIHRALELGVNWIDTAPVYGDGHSEKIIGQALKGKRDSVFISTKCGVRMAENKNDLAFNLKKQSIRKELEASLKRLKVDVIDLYQIHIPQPEEDLLEAWATLAELEKEGKIRCTGVSNFTIEQLKQIQSVHSAAFIQPEYSILAPGIEDEMLGYCSKQNIGIISYSPMYRGLLTGKFTKKRAENLPNDDNRLTLENFKEPYLSANLQLVELLRSIAEKNNKTVAQLAIAWVLRRPEITSAIVGARKPSQIEQTAPAGDWVLSGKEISEIKAIIDAHNIQIKKLN
jgi:aryl-alcohol dehydrogenase-like predicted oxidoreductase